MMVEQDIYKSCYQPASAPLLMTLLAETAAVKRALYGVKSVDQTLAICVVTFN